MNLRKIVLLTAVIIGVASLVAAQGIQPITLAQYQSPVLTFTGSGQTKTAPIGVSVSSAIVSISGPATTATLQIKASNDFGANYIAIPYADGTVTSNVPNRYSAGTWTYSGTAEVFWVNLAGMTNVEIVTSGTFTGASASVQIHASSSPTGGLF